jgi:hypothetical protein
LRQKNANQAIAAVQGRYKCRTSVVGALRLSAERAETVDKAEGTSSLERSSVHVPVPQWCASGSSCRNETGRRRTAYRSQFVSTMVCQKRTGFGNRGVGWTCWLGNKLGERAHPRPRAKQSSVSQFASHVGAGHLHPRFSGCIRHHSPVVAVRCCWTPRVAHWEGEHTRASVRPSLTQFISAGSVATCNWTARAGTNRCSCSVRSQMFF